MVNRVLNMNYSKNTACNTLRPQIDINVQMTHNHIYKTACKNKM